MFLQPATLILTSASCLSQLTNSIPILFYKPTTALTDPTAPILVPRTAQPVDIEQSDYEVELTVVVGKPMRDVREEDALDYVLGYTAGNDVILLYFFFRAQHHLNRNARLQTRFIRFPSASNK
jgi:hypothetical protein